MTEATFCKKAVRALWAAAGERRVHYYEVAPLGGEYLLLAGVCLTGGGG